MIGVVDDVRGFNRFYTRVLGLLRPDLAGSAFGLTEARVLFELAHRDEVAVSDLRRDLDLDAGYLSRILSGFTESGLVAREKSQADARRQVVRLTEDGRRAFDELDRLQAGAISTMLAPLDDGQRAELVASMGRIRRALGDETRVRGLVLRPPAPGDLGWVVERHGYRYATEYGWDTTFEALVARIVADFADRGDIKREAAWIAELDGERVGCVFCTAASDPAAADTAQLRLLLVEPSARGAGVGTRLVDECLRFARSAGYRRITLWTNDVLLAARRIYDRAGFQCDRREPHHSFGRDLVGEYWSRDL
ncbi:DNA-binding MarR family transcriptional regulator/GNAT superfamily N-acetyltransferase [Mycobacterium sp. OAS707]|uniref:bifunctional helix-turn-helix transcriptional regulator/GNAT family N-acetyltransferase n=1 Tax=Mycobacterium sp. OAS707 TaxID=2663822 RepID=UPI00178BE642|nr:helix-turn-helix domain-containing GNAT family N-acetyltransferase [Mycobacterium sp. OAS707]MBE1548414.1 DNA-binding MarR family transcriptional regulator/GNAT superfamily N-acetyltransferase [Mycobacterium sp. OAS707]